MRILMFYKSKLLAALLLLLIVMIGFSGLIDYQQQPKIMPSGQAVKVGVIAPFSGADRFRGDAWKKGKEIAQGLSPYLANGDSIEWLEIDDQGISENSVNALTTLVERDKVAVILVLSDSDSVLELAKAAQAQQFKTPILVVLASHPEITKYSPYIKQFNFDDSFQAAVAAFFVRDELLVDRVAIISEADNVHFSYLASEFSKQFINTEGLITEHHNLVAEQDYLALLQSIQSTQPELLYLPVSLAHVFKIKQALIELNWAPQLMLSDGILAGLKVQQEYPQSILNGVLAIDAFSYNDEFTRLGKRLLKQIAKMSLSIRDIGTSTALSMEGHAFVVEVMNQCLTVKNKPSCIDKQIQATLRFEGVKGLISFDGSAKAHRSLSINRVNGGKREFVVQVF